MDMMQVRRMRMVVLHGSMPVEVTVHSDRHRRMRVRMMAIGVRMMAIVMGMGVFVLHRLVRVLVCVLFRHVQDDARHHQDPAADQPHTQVSFA